MALTTLKDDLMQIPEERIMIKEQIKYSRPYGNFARVKPAAKRLLSSGTLALTETICYAVSLGGIAFMVLIGKNVPFSLLSDIFYETQYRNSIGTANVFYLNLAVYGLVLVSSLFFVIGRIHREIRLTRHDILYQAGKDIR